MASRRVFLETETCHRLIAECKSCIELAKLAGHRATVESYKKRLFALKTVRQRIVARDRDMSKADSTNASNRSHHHGREETKAAVAEV
jgi:hypothetical protein